MSSSQPTDWASACLVEGAIGAGADAQDGADNQSVFSGDDMSVRDMYEAIDGAGNGYARLSLHLCACAHHPHLCTTASERGVAMHVVSLCTDLCTAMAACCCCCCCCCCTGICCYPYPPPPLPLPPAGSYMVPESVDGFMIPEADIIGL